MKLIILDIDGVLATEEDSFKPNHDLYAYPFDAKCVQIFNEILEITNAQIVLSSDWRLMYNNDLEMLDELFKFNGIIRSPIDVTPNLGRNRDEEIKNYFNKNSNRIKQFVILDDSDLRIYPDNFVRCYINEGLKQLGIKERILSILS
jgi:hypothetical protein